MKLKNIIIGGGPIGLYFLSKSQDSILIEASEHLGGQIQQYYPEKEIVDIKNIESIKAIDYIKKLISQINLKDVHLNETVINVISGKPCKVKTNKSEYESDNVIIATGLGFSTPRDLGIEGSDNCKNIIYHLHDFSFLKDKKIAIFGGGDSALDWAKEISKISNNVSLIHRRTEFRGNADTIKGIKNLNVLLPYVPYSIEKEGDICTSIRIKKADEDKFIDLEVDYILVNFGHINKQMPFSLKYDDTFIHINDSLEAAPHVYVIGDAANYENKKRRIAPGNLEADKVLKIIG